MCVRAHVRVHAGMGLSSQSASELLLYSSLGKFFSTMLISLLPVSENER